LERRDGKARVESLKSRFGALIDPSQIEHAGDALIEGAAEPDERLRSAYAKTIDELAPLEWWLEEHPDRNVLTEAAAALVHEADKLAYRCRVLTGQQ
jgi:hypothetical protein